MARKTREQVWHELDNMGEDEVRARLADNPAGAEHAGLVSEWLAQKARVMAELETTSLEVLKRGSSWTRVPGAVGKVALVSVAAVALGFLLARRKHSSGAAVRARAPTSVPPGPVQSRVEALPEPR